MISSCRYCLTWSLIHPSFPPSNILNQTASGKTFSMGTGGEDFPSLSSFASSSSFTPSLPSTSSASSSSSSLSSSSSPTPPSSSLRRHTLADPLLPPSTYFELQQQKQRQQQQQQQQQQQKQQQQHQVAEEDLGILPRALRHLFDGIERRKEEAAQRRSPSPEFRVHLQFIEVCLCARLIALSLVLVHVHSLTRFSTCFRLHFVQSIEVWKHARLFARFTACSLVPSSRL